jgi:hypothetical protein
MSMSFGAKLNIDPAELLRMINGKVVPTKQVIAGLANALIGTFDFWSGFLKAC